MKGNNAKFKLNPEDFLKKKAIYCYNAGKSMDGKDSYSETIKNEGIRFDPGKQKCIETLEFDLVPVPGHHNIVDLKILGRLGTYAKTNRRGSPVIGCWFPFIDTKSTNYSNYGYITANTIPEDVDYIFTIGLGGCTIVATKHEVKGLCFYHEPTKTNWKDEIDYSKKQEVIKRITTKEIAGFAMIERSKAAPNGWIVHIQDFKGTAVSTLKSFKI